MRYVTLTDDRYFIGTVALVNSLCITGNPHDILVVDAGLTLDQRHRLAAVADVRPLPSCGPQILPAFLKPWVLMSAPRGTLAFIDSDIIVTGSLDSAAAAAAEGSIYVFPDGPPPLQTRCFEEAWANALHLGQPLRTQPYINSGFIALDSSRWKGLLERWIELCGRVSEVHLKLPHWTIPSDEVTTHPFAYPEQDVLNAILMSEVDRSATVIDDWQRAGVPKPEDATRIVDRLSLHCQSDGATTMLLHHFAHPKPWFAEARGCLTYEPYDELLVRLLTGPDLAIAPPPDAIPVWLRGGRMRSIERRVTRSQTMGGRLLRRARVVAHRHKTRALETLAGFHR